MFLGFDLPTRGALASPDTITRLAIEGEAMGFDYLTLSDHIVIPRDIEARYPYSTTGEFPSGGRTDWYEQLTSAAFVAAKTTRLQMVTSVMVVPHRPAVLTAKVLATVDLLFAQKGGYRRADRAVIRPGELVVFRQQVINVLLGHEHLHRPQTKALAIPVELHPFCARRPHSTSP